MALRGRGGGGGGVRRPRGRAGRHAAARGRKRRAKTDKSDAGSSGLLLPRRLPESWIPPAEVLEYRVLLRLQCSSSRSHRLGAAHPRGVFPAGRPGAERGRAAHRAGPGRVARRGRAAVSGRAAAGRHRPGHARRLEARMGQLRPAARCRPAADRREVSPPSCTGRAGHRAGGDLLAGRGGPVLVLPIGGPPHRAGCDRLVFRPQRRARAPVPAGTGGAAVGAVCRRNTRPRPRPRPHLLHKGEGPHDGKLAAISVARKFVRQACHILTELGDDALTAA